MPESARLPALPQALEQCLDQPEQFSLIRLRQIAEQACDLGVKWPELFLRQSETGPGQLDDRGPPIGWMRCSPHHALGLQRVDQRRDIAGCDAQLFPEVAHDLRPLAVQGSQQAHPGRADAAAFEERFRPARKRAVKGGKNLRKLVGRVG
jgi:hypothetical protein